MSRKEKWLVWCVVIVIAVPVLLYLPCHGDGRGVSTRSGEYMTNFRQIALAIHSYHGKNGCLPPAVVRDKEGKPLYSWRVLIMPELYADADDFHLDEPWDSPHNLPLSRKRYRAFESSLHDEDDMPGTTRVQLLVGPGTAFERDGLTLTDITKDGKNPILLVDGATRVPWSKPEDIPYDPAKPLPTFGGDYQRPVKFMCYHVGRKPGFFACFADGSTRFVDADTDEKAIRGMISRNGGE